MITADKAFLSAIDEKADLLLEKINSAKDNVTFSGKAYYVSAKDGNDLNDGLSPEKAIKSLDRVHTLPLEFGDAVLLERGCEWRGNGISLNLNGITIAAYGDGEKPIMNISLKNYAVPCEWLKTDTENVWKYKYPFGVDVGHIVCDGKVHCIKKCKGHHGFGDDYKELSEDLEFYCDRFNENYLYFHSENNPGERFRLMEIQRFVPGILIGAKSDIRVDNIKIVNAFFGISSGSIVNFHVSNCEFGFIGGSGRFNGNNENTVRLGNGVEVYGFCTNFTVENCYFHDIYDAGVTHQRGGNSPIPIVMENVVYRENLFERCIYSIEYFNNCNHEEDIMRHIRFTDNICRYAGGFGWQRPNKFARHIQGGWKGVINRKSPCEDYVVEGNIFDRSIDTILSISSIKESHLPKMRGNTYVQYAKKPYGANFIPYDRDLPFDEETEKFIKETRGETDAVVAVVPEYDGMCD